MLEHNKSLMPQLANKDLGVIWKVIVFSALETNLSVMAASVPAIKPLMVKFYPKLIGVTSRNQSTSSGLGTSQGNSWFSKTETQDEKSRKGSSRNPSHGETMITDPNHGKTTKAIGIIPNFLRKESRSKSSSNLSPVGDRADIRDWQLGVNDFCVDSTVEHNVPVNDRLPSANMTRLLQQDRQTRRSDDSEADSSSISEEEELEHATRPQLTARESHNNTI